MTVKEKYYSATIDDSMLYIDVNTAIAICEEALQKQRDICEHIYWDTLGLDDDKLVDRDISLEIKNASEPTWEDK